MRIESSATTITWIPSEAIGGSAKLPFSVGIAHYDQANELLEGEPTEYRVEQARATVAAGKRHIAAARERLG